MYRFEIGEVLAGSSQGNKTMGFITNELFDLAGDHAKSLRDEFESLNLTSEPEDHPDCREWQRINGDWLEYHESFQNDLIEILTEHLELPPFTFIDTRDGEHIVSVDYDEINLLFAFKSCPHHKVIEPHKVINDINAYTDEDNFEDFITVINDHGNLTLYRWAETEYKQVWSIV